jgi:AcrR family transcriptional regulator
MQTQPALERRARQRDDTRRAILDATEALLVEDGYDAFSMRRLAARCGYTAPTIYHHFGDKPRLLETLLDARFRKLLSQLSRVPAGLDPIEAVGWMARAFARFAARNPTHYRLINTLRAVEAPEPPVIEEVRELMRRPLRALAAGGRLRVDAETAAQVCWSVVHGVTSLRNTVPNYPWAPHLFDAAVDTVLRGLLREDRRDDGRKPGS